jgi:hypothetical protein
MREISLIQEELCRVISTAERWLTVKLAWDALITTRRIYQTLEGEQSITNTSGEPLGSASPLRRGYEDFRNGIMEEGSN